MPRRSKSYRFPWREHNRFGLLVDGPQFFPAMLDEIGNARLSVDLEMYLFESGTVAGQFIRALSDAASRGVRVCVLLDDFGARALARVDRQRLIDAGVGLRLYNPIRYGRLRRNLLRDHRKLLVVDGAVAFVGGTGITDAFAPPGDPARAWHEVMVEARGPVITDWQRLFSANWARWSHAPATPAQPALPGPAGTQSGRVTITQGPAGTEIKRSLLRHVRGAERRVWLATAYFVPSWKVLRALRAAARRGVDVRLLLPGPHTDHPAVRHAGRRYYSRLLRHGVRVYEYLPRFLHAKVLLCDNWASIGSSNVDRWNLRWNLEANQEIDDQGFAETVTSLFETDFAQSKEYHYERWRRRPWHRRLLERFWGMVDIWLQRH